MITSESLSYLGSLIAFWIILIEEGMLQVDLL